MNQKQELGKGIKALLGNIKKEPSNFQEPHSMVSGIIMVPLEQIKVNALQPRNEFNLAELEELAASIRSLGLIQPITIRRIADQEYQIISGERRFRACKLAGIKEVPAYIRTANDNEMLEMALVENIQRVDLNPIEIAITYQRLLEECNITQEQLSERVGKQRSTISNYARLLKLPPEIQNSVKSNQLSMGHARVLAGIDDLIAQKSLFEKTIQEHLSVRLIEKIAQDLHNKSNSSSVPKSTTSVSHNPMIRSLEDRISQMVGARTQIKRNEKGEGQIIIKFSSDHALNEILDRLDLI